MTKVDVTAHARDPAIVLSSARVTPEVLEAMCQLLKDSSVDVPVRVIYLIDNELGPLQTQKFLACSQCSSVREILIRFNNIGKEGCDAAARLVGVSSQIKRLDLGGNQLTSADARKLFKSVASSTSLTALGLAQNCIGPEGVATLCKALQRNTYLTYLDLSNNDIGPDGAQCIAELLSEPASSMQVLQLYGNALGPAGVSSICRALQHNRELQRLSLGKNGGTDTAAGDIAAMLATNDTLRELDLRLNQLTAKGIAILAQQGLTTNCSLHRLCLSSNAAAASGADALCKALSRNARSGLTHLDLSMCALGAPGGKRLASLVATSSSLVELNLSDNELDDAVASAVAQSVRQSTTTATLDLSSNLITDVGAEVLLAAVRANERIKSLVLEGNHIKRVLQKQLDDLQQHRREVVR